MTQVQSKTVVVQIGNSDDKLPQRSWSLFIMDARAVMERRCESIHFAGGSSAECLWQNFCIVGEITPALLPNLREEISSLCDMYGQDSIALTIGTTEFIE